MNNDGSPNTSNSNQSNFRLLRVYQPATRKWQDHTPSRPSHLELHKVLQAEKKSQNASSLGPMQSQKTQGFCIADLHHYLSKESRIRNCLLPNLDNQKFEGLTH